MKIVYFIKRLNTIGGIERVTVDKMNWLVDHGHSVWLVTTDQSDNEFSFDVDKRVKHVDLAINYSRQKDRSLITKPIFFIINIYRHTKRLKDLIKAIEPDILVSTLGNEAGIIAKIKTNASTIAEFHSSKIWLTNYRNMTYPRKMLDDFMLNKLFKQIEQFDKFVVLSTNEVSQWSLNNAICIPNSCLLSSQKKSEKTSSKKIIAVGRLAAEKNFSTLLDIWSKSGARNQGWHLEIYGDGPQKDLLQEKISVLELEKSVSLKGFCKNPTDIYSDASLLLMTSQYEGLSMVLLESHKFGVPTIAFESGGGTRDVIIEGVNGFIVPQGDVVGYSRVLDSIIANPSLLEKLQGGALNNSYRFDQDRIMVKWVSLFNQLRNEANQH